jgi:predicted dehydrogenase
LKTIRVAIIGVTQPHGQGYIDTLRLLPGVEIVGGYDLDEATRTRAATALGDGAPIYDRVETLLDETKPDAAVVTVPPVMGPDIIIAAANRGIHLVIEKPSARSAMEFLPALEAVEANGVAVWTGFLRRYSPMGRQIRALIEDGLLGNLVSAEIWHQSRNVRLRGPEHWMFQRDQTGGGMVHWLGVHWIDQMLFLNGGDVTELSAMLDTRTDGIDVEDTAAITLRFANRMIGSITCGYVLDGTPDQLSMRIHGDKGWVIWQSDNPEFTVHSSDNRWKSAPVRTFRFELSPFAGYGGAMGKAHMEDFLAAVRGEAPVGSGARDILRVLRILDAVQESNRTGCRVPIDSVTLSP